MGVVVRVKALFEFGLVLVFVHDGLLGRDKASCACSQNLYGRPVRRVVKFSFKSVRVFPQGGGDGNSHLLVAELFPLALVDIPLPVAQVELGVDVVVGGGSLRYGRPIVWVSAELPLWVVHWLDGGLGRPVHTVLERSKILLFKNWPKKSFKTARILCFGKKSFLSIQEWA